MLLADEEECHWFWFWEDGNSSSAASIQEEDGAAKKGAVQSLCELGAVD